MDFDMHSETYGDLNNSVRPLVVCLMKSKYCCLIFNGQVSSGANLACDPMQAVCSFWHDLPDGEMEDHNLQSRVEAHCERSLSNNKCPKDVLGHMGIILAHLIVL